MSEPKPKLPGSPSKTLQALNPHIWPSAGGASPAHLTASGPLPSKAGKSSAGGLAKPRGRKPMNKTETAYSLILEAKQRRGDIARFEREGITLRWPDGMTYTADFAVWRQVEAFPNRWTILTLIETKGAWIEQDALVKFRAARAHWPEFSFEMWQLKKGEWSRLL